MTERKISAEEIAQIPDECKIGRVFRKATISVKFAAFGTNANVVCMRKPLLPSQGEGHCPDPNCSMAKFPSGATVKNVDGVNVEPLPKWVEPDLSGTL